MELGEPVYKNKSRPLKAECDCLMSEGRWVDVPLIREAPSFTFLGYDGWKTKWFLDSIPNGVNIYFKFRILATISGEIECTCAGRSDCATTSRFNLPIPVQVSVPVPIDALGLALRAIPYAGWIYTGINLEYTINKIKDKLGDVSWAFEPALRVVLESADLICEGRFDENKLANHVLDIAASIDL